MRRLRIGKRNKFNARKTLYGGTLYDSAMEADYAASLDRMKLAGLVKYWERQRAFRLVVNGVLVSRYVADFAVLRPDGTVEVHEVKGRWTGGAKAKLRLFEALNPNTRLTVVGARYKSVWAVPARRRAHAS